MHLSPLLHTETHVHVLPAIPHAQDVYFGERRLDKYFKGSIPKDGVQLSSSVQPRSHLLSTTFSPSDPIRLYSPIRLEGVGTALLVAASTTDEWRDVASRFSAFLSMPDPYSTLSVEKGMRDEEIRPLAKRALLSSHPDKGGETSRLEEVLLARRVLLDSRARKAYLIYGWAGVLPVWDCDEGAGAPASDTANQEAANTVLLAADKKGGIHPVFQTELGANFLSDDPLRVASEALHVGSRSCPPVSWAVRSWVG